MLGNKIETLIPSPRRHSQFHHQKTLKFCLLHSLGMHIVERRLIERVQFFQVPIADEVIPVWVFQRAHAETIPGLLMDFSTDGVQILTNKATALEADYYQLIIHIDDVSSAHLMTTTIRRLWSKPEGALYVRNGCLFDNAEQSLAQIDVLQTARAIGKQWLRCELMAI